MVFGGQLAVRFRVRVFCLFCRTFHWSGLASSWTSFRMSLEKSEFGGLVIQLAISPARTNKGETSSCINSKSATAIKIKQGLTAKKNNMQYISNDPPLSKTNMTYPKQASFSRWCFFQFLQFMMGYVIFKGQHHRSLWSFQLLMATPFLAALLLRYAFKVLLIPSYLRVIQIRDHQQSGNGRIFWLNTPARTIWITIMDDLVSNLECPQSWKSFY